MAPGAILDQPVNSGAPDHRPAESSSDAGDALARADRIAAICRQVPGKILASVIVHGSLALDDFTPAHSDIDLRGVVDCPSSTRRWRRLRAGRGGAGTSPRSGRPARSDPGGPGDAFTRAADGTLCPPPPKRASARGVAAARAGPRRGALDLPPARPSASRRRATRADRSGTRRVGAERGRRAARALAVTDRRHPVRISHGAHRVQDLAIQRRTRPLLEGRGGIVDLAREPSLSAFGMLFANGRGNPSGSPQRRSADC
jgi:hypothetical protein